jgi:hypothetical protein
VPSALEVGLGRSFTVDVAVTNVTDLFCWQVDIYYQNAILQCTGAVEGPFMKSKASTIWVIDNDFDYNATHGRVRFGSSFIGPTPGATGDGVIATATFQTLALGITSLDIMDEMLLDSYLHDIPHTAVGGLVEVREPTHDVAISGAPRKNIIGQGFTTGITVNVENRGDFSETFEVTVYYGSEMIGTQTLANMLPGSRAVLTFVWDTTGVSTGYYIITATREGEVGEMFLAMGSSENGTTVYVGVPGDVNGDHVVDMRDIGEICTAFATVLGSSSYVANYDIVDDGRVDMRDIGIACNNFGKNDP